MFERFDLLSDHARRVIVCAQDYSRRLHHTNIGTEHLLLGLIKERSGIAAKILTSLDISFDAVFGRIVEVVGQGSQPSPGHIPFSRNAERLLELALQQSLRLNCTYIGTEHLLLGLVELNECFAAQTLIYLGADLGQVRNSALNTLLGRSVPPRPAESTSAEAEVRKRIAGLDEVGCEKTSQWITGRRKQLNLMARLLRNRRRELTAGK